MRYIRGYIIDQLTHYFRIDAQYFFNGAVWLTLIQVISILGGLAVSVVMANALDETIYGTYRYILGIGAVLCAFSLTGIGQSIFQTSSQGYIWFYAEGMRKNLIYSIGITFASLAGFTYYLLQDNVELALGCILIGVFQPLINTYQQIFPYLQGRRRFYESAMLQGAKTIFVTLTTIATVYITHNIFWLVGSYFLANTITNLTIHILYKPKEILPTEETVRKRYMDYAWSTSIRNIINIIAFRIDSIIVFQQLGATNLALYTVATILPEQIKGSFKNIITLLIPKYAQHENLDSIKKSMFKRSLQLFFVFTLIMVIYVTISPYLYTFIFPKYSESIILSQLLALSFPAMIALIPSSALQSQTADKQLNKLNTSVSIFLIITTLVFTTTHGLLGAIIAKVVTRYINVILGYYYFFRKEV